VVFLAHWCPHCQREVPRLVEWSESGDLPAGVDVVAVATATTPERDNFPPSAWLTEERWPFDVLLDDARSTAAFAYGLSAYPFFTLLDEQGRVLLRGSGDVDADSLTERIEAALAAEAPVATT
jgi:thiol-disulfide isomerase/thioredoxin